MDEMNTILTEEEYYEAMQDYEAWLDEREKSHEIWLDKQEQEDA